MERGNDNDVFGHDLWGGSVPDSTPQEDNSRTWQNQLYQGFQQHATSQGYQEKLRFQAAQHDFERSQWNEKLESLMNAWQEETNLVLAKEKESIRIQVSTLKSVFQQQLLDSIKEVADLEKKVAILENEKAKALKDVELVSSKYGLRLRELEQQLTQSQIIFEHEKEKLEREITKVQSISDGRSMEVQRLQHLINGGSNQRLIKDDPHLVLDETSYTNPMIDNEHAEERYISASDNSSVITERANLQRNRSEGSISSGFIARMNMLTSR
ncbi:hypothetical protein BD770DRAFT_449931 [Pilaira anomala]|nr:hypothetical protein BD770DRAFT_449931 [Pilaira anomala]